MFHILLYEPEIPPNTGNIIRLCANSGSTLHLIHPLGFELDDKKLRRAGLDYAEYAAVREHASLDACLKTLKPGRLFAFTTKGGNAHSSPSYREGDAFLFGPETRGLPDDVVAGIEKDNWLRVPMLENSRSLNLSNTVAVVLYEAWRQAGYEGALIK
ncbi:tRNA (uridine(34)/cytosine(34)/5-carboxymethylaminomethyluridine(34)-2'-O)-methyltransferase TrmL [Solemya velum gill symbiont]|uniref:tRNA (uridine(34)/cytosine(34)/5- carboxymethylaminomethyluridine(34)-2'-O)- methyltransferase TrmL n=1 Tax=Solemya velum gill symbiont TaxID=2340 RepID=UPI0009964819|nr:tRNA (uridine(34)/cytosine(34)/5-carboxymethylaminomethyluridine(34)-2'-O)-methyltransferase TrmL [Solemya velum gill symbiont]OOZ16135.1 tRNA (uridine(34)/cytosine(34)/5-carboxymethylaminomethyluridine(34)-2'-O)-methyltransferase TrmL [Solemya velum gill symbiont]OOZ18901.1 tRNA (uridine(34)/cytosine(34)/5-carboxymethylaminomethyluridine(34)-2'-O)-methyltransferase TrmL [Solemya velum gill symbiont]OOZ20586.1 tRNA (uridine(34)/cytosine(34)/5-carboxymethylaminomethyluridine(34)-2'-O)-methyltr